MFSPSSLPYSPSTVPFTLISPSLSLILSALFYLSSCWSVFELWTLKLVISNSNVEELWVATQKHPSIPPLLHTSPVASSWYNIFSCRKLQPECGPNLMASSLEDLPMWLAVQATHNEPGSSLKAFHDPAVCFLVEHRPTNVFSS